MGDKVGMSSSWADELLCRPADQREGMSEGEIVTAWTAWLYEQHGGGLPEVALDAIYGKAWEDGHSAGLQEVEGYFIELVELAEKIIDAVR